MEQFERGERGEREREIGVKMGDYQDKTALQLSDTNFSIHSIKGGSVTIVFSVVQLYKQVFINRKHKIR